MCRRVFVAAVFVVAVSAPADAQDRTQAAVTGAGLLSIQPTDDAYLGLPYLDHALGGIGPGLLLGFHVRYRRVAFNAEYTTTWIEVQQAGRTVPGGISPVGGSGPGRLRDSMVSALVGAHLGRDKTTTDILAGVSQLIDTPTSSGMPIEGFGTDVRRQVFTAGVDVVHQVASRASIVMTARGYLGVDRSAPQQQVGIGRQIFHVGAGVRFALGT